jgi:hypothetical protein
MSDLSKGQEANQAALGGFKVVISATGWLCRLDKKTFGYCLLNFEIDSNIATFRSHNFLNPLYVYLFASSMYFRRKLTTSGEVCEALWNSRSPASPTSKRGWKRMVAIAS